MAASSRGFATPFGLKLRRLDVSPLHHHGFELRKRRKICVDGDRVRPSRIRCCRSDSVVPIRRTSGPGKSVKKAEEWRFDPKKSPHRVRIQAVPAMPFSSPQMF